MFKISNWLTFFQFSIFLGQLKFIFKWFMSSLLFWDHLKMYFMYCPVRIHATASMAIREFSARPTGMNAGPTPVRTGALASMGLQNITALAQKVSWVSSNIPYIIYFKSMHHVNHFNFTWFFNLQPLNLSQNRSVT